MRCGGGRWSFPIQQNLADFGGIFWGRRVNPCFIRIFGCMLPFSWVTSGSRNNRAHRPALSVSHPAFKWKHLSQICATCFDFTLLYIVNDQNVLIHSLPTFELYFEFQTEWPGLHLNTKSALNTLVCDWAKNWCLAKTASFSQLQWKMSGSESPAHHEKLCLSIIFSTLLYIYAWYMT